MTIRIVPLIGAVMAALAASPCHAQESIAPHSLEFDKTIEPEGIVVQDLTGGVGAGESNDGGGGSMIQIMQVQPNSGNGVSTSVSAQRFSARGR